jgi:UDP-glucuronate 4-epimerase
MKKNNLAMKYVLVTGGAGFIGSSLCAKLLDNNLNVVALDDFNDFYDPKLKLKNIAALKKNKNFELVKGDIVSAQTVNKVFEEYEIFAVFHLAARAGVRPSIVEPELYQKVNIEGTLNLLKAAVEHKVEKFIFASSSSVYGNNKKVPFSETDPVDNPISPYAATKKAGELLCYTFHHLYKMPIACMRFFTVYGPRQRPEMAIHKFIRAVSTDKIIEMYGDGSTKRDYTFIDDIVDGLWKVYNSKFGYEIFNLGNCDAVSLKNLIEVIGNALGKIPKIKQLPMQAGDVDLTNADISKAKKYFGYAPQTRIEDGIIKTVAWYQGKTEW